MFHTLLWVLIRLAYRVFHTMGGLMLLSCWICLSSCFGITGAGLMITSDKDSYMEGHAANLNCTISSGFTFAEWKNGTSNDRMTICSSAGCIPPSFDTYTFTVGPTSIAIFISSLSRINDYIPWTCVNSISLESTSFKLRWAEANPSSASPSPPGELGTVALVLLIPFIGIIIWIFRSGKLQIYWLEAEIEMSCVYLHWKTTMECQPNSMEVQYGTLNKKAVHDDDKYSVYLTNLNPGTEYKLIISCQRMKDGRRIKSDKISVYTLCSLSGKHGKGKQFQLNPLKLTVTQSTVEMSWNSTLDLKGNSTKVAFNKSEKEVIGPSGMFRTAFEALRPNTEYAFSIDGVGEKGELFSSGEIKMKTLKAHKSPPEKESSRKESVEEKDFESRSHRQVGCEPSHSDTTHRSHLEKHGLETVNEIKNRSKTSRGNTSDELENGRAARMSQQTTSSLEQMKIQPIQGDELLDLKRSKETFHGEIQDTEDGVSPRIKRKKKKRNVNA